MNLILHQGIKPNLTDGESVLIFVPPERFELSTDGFEVQYSVQLSYGGNVDGYYNGNFPHSWWLIFIGV